MLARVRIAVEIKTLMSWSTLPVGTVIPSSDPRCAAVDAERRLSGDAELRISIDEFDDWHFERGWWRLWSEVVFHWIPDFGEIHAACGHTLLPSFADTVAIDDAAYCATCLKAWEARG